MSIRPPAGKPYGGEVTFWGNGKMLVAFSPRVLSITSRNGPWIQFAGLHDTHANKGDGSSDDEVDASTSSQPAERLRYASRDGAAVAYDRVIRTAPSTSVIVKTENEDSDMDKDDDDQGSTAVAIKAEESGPSDSNSEWADSVATTIDIVQKQEVAVNQGMVKRLHDIGGQWRFHSPKYNPGLGSGISLSFSIRQNHDIPDQMCAPGHCKTMPSQSSRYPRRIFYCGELHITAEEGKPDLHYLIRQFDVPKRTSPGHITILLGNRFDQNTICMHTWFFGNGKMRIELPAAMIPSYKGQDAWISFSGLKCGWPRGA